MLTFILVWLVLMVLFLIGNHRWSKRMEAYDAAMQQALHNNATPRQLYKGRSRVFRDN